MSFSDFILAILVLAGAACVLWILDINPYSNKLKVYSQICSNMILENTYCKGDWQDNPVETFTVNKSADQIIYEFEHQPGSSVYEGCTIQDRKNWVCTDESTNQYIMAKDGMLIYDDNSDTRQISRLEWLQNKFLKIVS
jgi:hypothetical protein